MFHSPVNRKENKTEIKIVLSKVEIFDTKGFLKVNSQNLGMRFSQVK